MTDHTVNDDYFFGAFADSWWDRDSRMRGLASFQGPRFRYFDRFVGEWTGKRVLDVGCGGGFTTEFLCERGADVCGIDPSPRLIDAARRHAEQTGRRIDYTVGKAEELPYDDRCFDVVTCVDVLEHVEDPARTIGEIARVLMPGGLFLYDTINRTPLSRLVMIWIPEYLTRIVPRGAHRWQDFITPKEMRRYLADAGLVPVDKMRGLSILGQRRDGRLIFLRTPDVSATYMSVARRPVDLVEE
ncbi:bifunctional 2-polyprenyl-6-hydroxyphenol methylase/3-demethylubiquinol 3-O-methyltransferase UbiG [Nocardia transvalensis]|uniref:bifunctional 2-polyprenyl-6-hydroxyphenol methylase/3-demethylubiquinol 3-O-methyltransferase UbiG n=1 Tax=Nocardia transvalensis TaxID=37333 RepID=UPI0018958208|nr:bifunctional 2-polyprenyl-6-hydroxyphenol methylase/3-demethylubiquinol 3-O-methyltransferase UbiG [Nocardia transvalensis]MBF6329914.1 3-demethylubiquinone-9 3-O-methyltransferase [Nocardia transvalensis]